VFNPLSHKDYFIKDLLSFALVQKWPKGRSMPVFFCCSWQKRWNGGIAIAGYTMNSSEGEYLPIRLIRG
jgi:hypothetical protein